MFFQLPYFLVNLETFKLKLVQSPSFLGLSVCVCLCLLLFRQKPFNQFPCTTFLQSQENITASLTEQFTESEQRCQTPTLEKVIVQWSCVLRAHAVRHGHQGGERLAVVQCKHKPGPSASLDHLQQQHQYTYTHAYPHTHSSHDIMSRVSLAAPHLLM